MNFEKSTYVFHLFFLRNRNSRDQQKSVFRKQIAIALEFNKPIMIHCRDASDDCLNILKELVPREYKIHRHCFTGDAEEVSKWLDAFPNMYFSFTNLIGFKNLHRTQGLRSAVTKIPLHRILIETDAPYFRPQKVIFLIIIL